MSLRRTFLYLALVWLVFMAAVVLWWYVDTRDGDGEVHHVRVAVTAPAAAELSALIYYAHDYALFERHGVRVEIVESEAGVDSLEALERGEVDMATSLEFPVVRQIADGKSPRVLAELARADYLSVLAYADAGINTPRDVMGKRIAYPRGTQSELAIELFLHRYGLSSDDVELVSVSTQEAVDMFMRHEVDVVSHWYPHIENMKRARGEGDVREFRLDGIGPNYWLLVTHPRVIVSQSDALDAFMKAVIDARRALPNDEDVLAYVVERGLVDKEYVNGVVASLVQYDVGLTSDMLNAMRGEAQWLHDRGYDVMRESILPFIYDQSLLLADPDSITAY